MNRANDPRDVVEALRGAWAVPEAEADEWSLLISGQVDACMASGAWRRESSADEKALKIGGCLRESQTPTQAALGMALFSITELKDEEYDEMLSQAELRYSRRLLLVSVGGGSFWWRPRVEWCDQPQADLLFGVPVNALSPGVQPDRSFCSVLVECRDRGPRRTREDIEEDCRRSRGRILAGLPSCVRYWDDEVMEDSRSCALEIARIAIASLPTPENLEASYALARKRVFRGAAWYYWDPMVCDECHTKDTVRV